MEIGVANTNLMQQELFGLDEAFWFVENAGKENGLENDQANDLYLDDDTEHFDSAFESSPSLFDNEWMTTKIDLDEQFYVNVVTDEVVGLSTSHGVVNVDISSSNTSQISTDSTDIYDSMLGDSPDSPEQNVPNLEGDLEASPQISDFIDALCSGKIAMNFPDLPCSAMEKALDEESQSSSPVANSQISKISQSPLGTPPSENPLHSNQLPTNSHTDLETNPPKKNNLKMKRKTPEQKQRKQLQNRNAATRYRYKKRSEQETLNSQYESLEKENQELKLKIESLQQETKYLKSLVIDIYNKKSTC